MYNGVREKNNKILFLLDNINLFFKMYAIYNIYIYCTYNYINYINNYI